MEQVINKKDGVDTYALYLDYVWFSTVDGGLLREERRLLVKNLVCFYSRAKGDKRASWKVAKYDDHDQAREALMKNLGREVSNCGVQLIGKPLIVELTTTDVEAVEKNEAPYTRHTGNSVIERECGKIDDDEWKAEGFA